VRPFRWESSPPRIVSRLRFLGVNVAGVFISLFGGFTASLFAAISAMLEWVLAHPGVESQTDITRILNLRRFATGGVGCVVPFGLLLAGVSVIAWFTKMLPRWLVWLGMVIAGIAELSASLWSSCLPLFSCQRAEKQTPASGCLTMGGMS
jgi:hypothetical protein